MKRRKRSKDEILQEILSICYKGENLTRIINRSNTNIIVVRYFIDMLVEKNMLEKINGSPVIYRTTPEGRAVSEWLKMYHDQMSGIFG